MHCVYYPDLPTARIFYSRRPSMTNGSTTTAAVAAAANEEEVWSRDDHDWALTYNIWHMLPWMERKDMASKYGCKTIGEFEEYMSIRRALEVEKKPYSNNEAYVEGMRQRNEQQNNRKLAAIPNDLDDQEDALDEEQKLTLLQVSPKESCKETNPDDSLSHDELVKVGGFILTIPEELAHSIFAFLSVDTFATLARVSPHWKHLCRTETVYRKLCERIYLHQSKRRVLNVMRFGGSYRTMLYLRPRVRTGLYVMRYAQVSYSCMCRSCGRMYVRLSVAMIMCAVVL
jgi:F-box protein 9